MTGLIKSFNIVEWYVIAQFGLLMACACTGICFILAGDPIFERAEWIGLGVLISVCAIGTIVITQNHKNRR